MRGYIFSWAQPAAIIELPVFAYLMPNLLKFNQGYISHKKSEPLLYKDIDNFNNYGVLQLRKKKLIDFF